MKLNRKELEILDFLVQRSATITSIALALDLKVPNASIYIAKLSAHGLVTVARDRNKKTISINDWLLFSFSNLKNSFPTLKLGDILIGKVPFLLAFLKSRKEFRINELDIPLASAKRSLARLRSIGLISMQKKGIYLFRKESEHIAEFCRTVLMFVNAHEARNIVGAIDHCLFSFNSAGEMGIIVVTNRKLVSNQYWPTAYSAAGDYGLQLISAGKYYYTKIKPGLGDMIVQMLSIGRDTRAISYATALILKNDYDPMRLLKVRQTFGLELSYISGFIDYIKSKGKKSFQGIDSLRESEMIFNA